MFTAAADIPDESFGALSHEDARKAIRENSRPWIMGLMALDVMLILAATYLAGIFVRYFWLPSILLRHLAVPSLVTAGLAACVFAQLGLYRRSFAMSVRDEFYHVVAALSLASLPIFVLFSLWPSLSTSRVVALFGLIFSIAFVGCARGIVHEVRAALELANPRRIVVIGSHERLEGAEDAMRSLPNARVFRIAVPNIDGLGAVSAEAIETQPWFRHAVEWNCDTLVFTEFLAPTLMPHVLAAATRKGMTIAFAPPRMRVHAYDLTIEKIGKQAMIVAKPLSATLPINRLLKRGFDTSVAFCALVLFVPVMLLVAALVWLDDRGPVLYRQTRVGRNGRTFEIFKFRSMRLDAEHGGAQFATSGDARVTRIGKLIRRTSLDELPQLFNVLKGEMSIVGPRPERPVFVEQFSAQYPRYGERHLVTPGITGWAQVHGKRVLDANDVPEKLHGDLFYVENWSLFMDLAVCCKTAAEVLFHKAA